MSVCSSVLPSRATATFARSLLRVARSSSSTSPLLGFSSAASSYSTSACSSLPVAASRRPRLKWSCDARSLARSSASRASVSLGSQAQRLGVFDDGEVVVLAALGVAPRCSAPDAAQPPANRQTHRQHCQAVAAEKFRSGRDAVTTSTPRGILNAKSLSANPTFSFRFVKEKLDVPPCASIVTSPRIRASPGRPPAPANRSPVGGFWVPASAPRCRRRIPAGSSTSDAVKSRVRLPLPARNSAGVVASSSGGTVDR